MFKELTDIIIKLSFIDFFYEQSFLVLTEKGKREWAELSH